MKAIVWTAYGGPDVLQLREVDQPNPGDTDVLIRVKATTVTAGEVEMRRFRFFSVLTIPLRLFFGVFKPRGERILGQELAGEVVAIGSGVTKFDVGDRVCAHAGLRFGGYAEYAALPEKSLMVDIPENVSYEQAATLPTAGLYARYFVERGRLDSGQSVLVIGGGGSIGSFTIQLAKKAGAEVTAVDRGDKLDFMASLGADHVIDFMEEDFSRRTDSFDTIFDVIDKSWYTRAAKSLKSGGVYLHSNVSLFRLIQTKLARKRGGRTSGFVADGNDREGLEVLLSLVEKGDLEVAIDSVYSLEEMATAHTYAETGDKLGHIVISV